MSQLQVQVRGFENLKLIAGTCDSWQVTCNSSWVIQDAINGQNTIKIHANNGLLIY